MSRATSLLSYVSRGRPEDRKSYIIFSKLPLKVVPDITRSIVLANTASFCATFVGDHASYLRVPARWHRSFRFDSRKTSRMQNSSTSVRIAQLESVTHIQFLNRMKCWLLPSQHYILALSRVWAYRKLRCSRCRWVNSPFFTLLSPSFSFHKHC